MSQKVYLSGKVEVKSTFSQKAEPVDKKKVRSRGPNLIGQLKNSEVIRLGNIEEKDFNNRWATALQILQTGKMPSNAQLNTVKGNLTKAKKKIEALEAELAKLKKAKSK